MKRVFVFLTLVMLGASATAQTRDWTQPGHPPLYQAPTLDTIHRDDSARRAREGEADLARMRAEDARQIQATQAASDTARLAPYTPTPGTTLIPAFEHKIKPAQDPR